MFKTMLTHAENWFKELGLNADHEYHRAVTAFLAWASDEDQKVADAVALLSSKGYTVTAPAAPATAAE